MILFVLAFLAAAPLAWMSLDPNAGNTLLSLTSGAKARPQLANHTAFTVPSR
jgi:hypothetical protein